MQGNQEAQLEQELQLINQKLDRVQKKHAGKSGGKGKAPTGLAAKKNKDPNAVPNYLKATQSHQRKKQDDGKVQPSRSPDVKRAEHQTQWNANPPPNIVEPTRRHRGPIPPTPTPGAKDADKTALRADFMPERSKFAEDQSAFTTPAVTPAATPGAPELGKARVRGMQHKSEPPMVDPEVDLARVLCQMQLPSTPVVFSKVRPSCEQDRFDELLEAFSPAAKRIPPQATKLVMQTVEES